MNDVYALLRAEQEFQFAESSEGPWHSTRLSGDNYYEVRYNEGIWSSPTLIVNGENGTDGQPGAAATIEVGTVTSGYTASVVNSGTPSAAILDFIIPVGGGGGGQIYTAGEGINISAGGTISFDTNALSGTATSSALDAHINDSAVHVPAGGTSGQVLTKNSSGFAWADPQGGSGASYTAGTGINISEQNVISVASDLLNGYATTNYVENAVSGRATTSALNAHTTNSTIHVTSEDKTNWDAKLDSTALDGYATTGYVDDAIADIGTTSSYVRPVIEAYEGVAYLYPTDGYWLIGKGNAPTSGVVTLDTQLSSFISGNVTTCEGMIAVPESGFVEGGGNVFIQSGFVAGKLNTFRCVWMRGYNNLIFGCLVQPMGVINRFGLNIRWPNWTWDFPYINDTEPEYDLEVTACAAYPDAVGGYVISGYDQTTEKPIYAQPEGIYSISYGLGMMQWTLNENGAATYLQTETMADSPVTGPWFDIRTQESGAMTVVLPDE